MSARKFVREREGDGRAEDVSLKILAKLRRGDPEPDFDLDLHGLDSSSARALVREEVRDARHDGLRCVRLIHGRGLHSSSGAVLRDQLPNWLCEPELAGDVLAFARNPRDRGGSTLVLLRRAGRGR